MRIFVSEQAEVFRSSSSLSSVLTFARHGSNDGVPFDREGGIT